MSAKGATAHIAFAPAKPAANSRPRFPRRAQRCLLPPGYCQQRSPRPSRRASDAAPTPVHAIRPAGSEAKTPFRPPPPISIRGGIMPSPLLYYPLPPIRDRALAQNVPVSSRKKRGSDQTRRRPSWGGPGDGEWIAALVSLNRRPQSSSVCTERDVRVGRGLCRQLGQEKVSARVLYRSWDRNVRAGTRQGVVREKRSTST
jgi:hypothetical protein